jgi:hypothetical protein
MAFNTLFIEDPNRWPWPTGIVQSHCALIACRTFAVGFITRPGVDQVASTTHGDGLGEVPDLERGPDRRRRAWDEPHVIDDHCLEPFESDGHAVGPGVQRGDGERSAGVGDGVEGRPRGEVLHGDRGVRDHAADGINDDAGDGRRGAALGVRERRDEQHGETEQTDSELHEGVPPALSHTPA